MIELEPDERVALFEKARSLEPGTEVELTWWSSRASGDGRISREGEVGEGDPVMLFLTDETKCDYCLRGVNLEKRYGGINVVGKSPASNRNPTVGHLLDIEVLDDRGDEA